MKPLMEPDMTDLELLEHVAKAAGIEYNAEKSKPHPKSGAFWGLWLVIHGEPYEGQRRHWNPLTNDGDALRLAVKLNLGRAIINGYQHIDSDADIYAATRRSIVRAAADIDRPTVDNIA